MRNPIRIPMRLVATAGMLLFMALGVSVSALPAGADGGNHGIVQGQGDHGEHGQKHCPSGQGHHHNAQGNEGKSDQGKNSDRSEGNSDQGKGDHGHGKHCGEKPPVSVPFATPEAGIGLAGVAGLFGLGWVVARRRRSLAA